jgi:hypothetical protein
MPEGTLGLANQDRPRRLSSPKKIASYCVPASPAGVASAFTAPVTDSRIEAGRGPATPQCTRRVNASVVVEMDRGFHGREDRSRTCDLRVQGAPLCRLSYFPRWCVAKMPGGVPGPCFSHAEACEQGRDLEMRAGIEPAHNGVANRRVPISPPHRARAFSPPRSCGEAQGRGAGKFP